MLHFLKNIKKNTCRYHYQNLDDMIYSSWDIEQNILKLVILGHFLPFYPLKTPKIKILKSENICWRYPHFTHVHQKSQSCDVSFLRYGVRQTEFFVIMDHFLPFYPPMDPENQNFEKMKKTLEDIIILQMFTINDSHMIYGFSDMECNRQIFLSFWTVFCPFTPLTIQKIKILKNWKKPWRYHFTSVSQKSRSYAILFPRYGM